MKTYFKTSMRMFKKHLAKMFSISFIILISIGLISGVAASPSRVNDSITEYYKDRNVADLLIKSTNTTGFTLDDVNKIRDLYKNDEIMLSTSFDIENDGKVVRYQYLDFDDININKLELLEGRYPKDDNEVLVEKLDSVKDLDNIDDNIIYNDMTYRVVGIVKNPYYFQYRK